MTLLKVEVIKDKSLSLIVMFVSVELLITAVPVKPFIKFLSLEIIV